MRRWLRVVWELVARGRVARRWCERRRVRVLRVQRQPIAWTRAEAVAWGAVVNGPLWQKLRAMTEDSCLARLHPGRQRGADELRAVAQEVLGRLGQMDYLERVQAPASPPDSDGTAAEVEEDAGAESAVQFTSER